MAKEPQHHLETNHAYEARMAQRDIHHNIRDMTWEKPKDQRCNCGEADCPICREGFEELLDQYRKTTPWVNDPQVMFQSVQGHEEELLAPVMPWWLPYRRYILVMLLSGLGSLIGATIAILILT